MKTLITSIYQEDFIVEGEYELDARVIELSNKPYGYTAIPAMKVDPFKMKVSVMEHLTFDEAAECLNTHFAF